MVPYVWWFVHSGIQFSLFPFIYFHLYAFAIVTLLFVSLSPFFFSFFWVSVMNACSLDIVDFCDDASTELINMASGLATRGSDEVRFPPPFSVEEYLRCYRRNLDARRFSILPPGSRMTLSLHDSTPGTVVHGWTTRWKHWGGRRPVVAMVTIQISTCRSLTVVKRSSTKGAWQSSFLAWLMLLKCRNGRMCHCGAAIPSCAVTGSARELLLGAQYWF